MYQYQCDFLSFDQDSYIFHLEPNQPDTLVMLSSNIHASRIFNRTKSLIMVDTPNSQYSLKALAAQLKKVCKFSLTIVYQAEENMKNVATICQSTTKNQTDTYLFYTGSDFVQFESNLHKYNHKLNYISLNNILTKIKSKYKLVQNQDQLKEYLIQHQPKQIDYKHVAQLFEQEIKGNPNACRVKLYDPNDDYFKILRAMLRQRFNYKEAVDHLCNLASEINYDDPMLGSFRPEKIKSFYSENKDVFMSDIRALKQYTNDNFAHMFINTILRCSQSPLDLYYLLPIYQTLSHKIAELYRNSVNKLQKPSKVYRGCYFSEKEINFFKSNVGSLIHMPGFLSTSCNRETALNFTQNALIIIGIEHQKPANQDSEFGFANIKSFSHFQYEQEVLFSCLSIFKMKHCRRARDQEKDKDYIQITLCYVPQEDLSQSDSPNSAEQNHRNISCQGDLLYLLKDKSPEALHQAYLYWKKYMPLLYNLNGTSKKLFYKRIKVLKILLELQIKKKNYQEMLDEIETFNKMISYWCSYEIKLNRNWLLLKQADLIQCIFQQIQQAKKILFPEQFENFITTTTQLLKLHDKTAAQKYQLEMRSYFQKESTPFRYFDIQDEQLQISLPQMPESLSSLKNFQEIKYQFMRSFIFTNVACLSHRINEIQKYCLDFDIDRIAEIPDVPNLVEKFKANKYQIITCISPETFIELIKSKLFLEPGQFTVIYFLNKEQQRKRENQNMQINTVITYKYLQKEIKIVTGSAFKFNSNSAPRNNFLMPSLPSNELFYQNFQSSLHAHFLISSILKQQTEKMKSFEYFATIANIFLKKEDQLNQNQLEFLFQKIRNEKYLFKYERAINLITQYKKFEKIFQMLSMSLNSGILIYFASLIKTINTEINESSYRPTFKNQAFKAFYHHQFEGEQVQFFKRNKGKFIQNQNLLICSKIQKQFSDFQSKDIIEIRVPERKRKKRLLEIGNYCLSQQFQYNFLEDDRKIFFNFLCTFEIEEVKLQKYRKTIVLNYIEADNFYRLPIDQEQPLFLISSVYETNLSLRIDKTLHHARARHVKNQGQVYANLIPDEGYKNIQKDEIKYWEHMHDLCWLEWINKTNLHSQFKKASQLLNSMTNILELNMKINQSIKQSEKMVKLFQERVNLGSLTKKIFVEGENTFVEKKDKLQFLKRMGQFIISKTKLNQKLIKLNLKQNQSSFILQNSRQFIDLIKIMVISLKQRSAYLYDQIPIEKKFKLASLRFLRDWVLVTKTQKWSQEEQLKEICFDLYTSSLNFSYELPIQEQYYPNIFQTNFQSSNNNHQNSQSESQNQSNIQNVERLCEQSQCCDNDDIISTDNSGLLDQKRFIQYDFLRQTVEIVHIKILSSMMELIRFLSNLEYDEKQLKQAERKYLKQRQLELYKRELEKGSKIQLQENQEGLKELSNDGSQSQTRSSSKISSFSTEPTQLFSKSYQISIEDMEKQVKDFKKRQKQQLFELHRVRNPFEVTRRVKKYQEIYQKLQMIWSYLNVTFFKVFKEQRKLEFSKMKDVQILSRKQQKQCICEYIGQATKIVQKIQIFIDQCYQRSMNEYLSKIKMSIKDKNHANYASEEIQRLEITTFLLYLQKQIEEDEQEQIDLEIEKKIHQQNLKSKVDDINIKLLQQNRKCMKFYKQVEQNYFTFLEKDKQKYGLQGRAKLFYISRHFKKLKCLLNSMTKFQDIRKISPEDIRKSLDKIYRQIFTVRNFIRK